MSKPTVPGATNRQDAVSRRGLLSLATASATGLTLGGCAQQASGQLSAEVSAPFGERVAVYGPSQAGIDRPAIPQSQLELGVFDLADGVSPGAALAKLGEAVSDVASCRSARLAGTEPGDLTIAIGLGPRLVAAVNPTLPGAAQLPRFAREQIAASDRDGDVMVQVCGSDPLAVTLASGALADAVHAVGGTERWSQGGFRRYGSDGYALNLLGFRDGIVQPAPTELAAELWLDAPQQVTGATIAVVRRLRVDLPGFLDMPLTDQESAVGRHRATGCPLSGGTVTTPLDLGSKTQEGSYVVPATAHARRADPGVTGVGVMLRRGYNYVNGPDDQGLLFIAFHRELRTFTETQYQLDASDALMEHTLATASATFLVLPGFGPGAPLGSHLFS